MTFAPPTPYFVNIYLTPNGTFTYPGGPVPNREKSMRMASVMPDKLNSRVRVTSLKKAEG